MQRKRKPSSKKSRKRWEYGQVHPYSFDSNEAWCNPSMALLGSGVVVFGVILLAAVITDHNGHFWDHHDDEDGHFHSGKDSPSIIADYARAIDQLQRDVEAQEDRLNCPVGTHGWHPKGTLQRPTCRVNYPWPHAVDQDILSEKKDPCVDFEAYVCDGWHKSSGDKVGSLRGVPPSRGFSELAYRNALLREHVSLSDTELLDDGSDNRALFHTLVSSCTNSLAGELFSDLDDLSNRLKQLTRKRSNEHIGFLFGRAQCYGASPVLHVTPGVDVTDKSRKVLYVEPMGVLGARSISLDLDAKKYMKKHVAMITLACQVLDQVGLSGGKTCVADTLRMEDRLVWDRKEPTQEEEKEEELPVIMTRSAPETPSFFSSGWWEAYEHGLVNGGCVSEENLQDVRRSGLWTHDSGYLDNLLSLDNAEDGSPTDKDWILFLRMSVVLDYLEHANIARLEMFLSYSSPSPSKERNEAQLTFGSRPETHPAKSNSPHMRGYYTASNGKGHFGPSRKRESKALTGMIDAFLHHRQHEHSAWKKAHYVQVDSVEPDIEAFWGVCSQVAGMYLPGIKDNTFAEAITTPKERGRIRMMVGSIVNAIVDSIQESHLLSDKAKQKLAEKARAIAIRVAVPWTNEPEYHTELDIEGKSFYADSVRVRSWHMRNAFEGVFGSSRDRKSRKEPYHFGMSTSEVNAYYAPDENSINILAGILGAPFYSERYTNASLYATIGAVIGHELCHGFDSEGVKFDPEGSYRSWLDPKDEQAYESREQCFIDEYTVRTRLGNINNGQHTLTENIADTMGLRASLRAFMTTFPRITDMKHTMREFVEAYGQVWCGNQSPAQEAAQIEYDVHSPGGVRINGAIRNLRMPNGKSPLEVAYGCPANAPMLGNQVCTLW
jgi:hypothetical protein